MTLDGLAKYHGEKARWVLDAWTETWLAPARASWCLDEDLGHVQCPLLAIHGNRDEYGSPKHLERVARLCMGRSEAVLIKACGHVPHREQPERVLHEVVHLLPGGATAEANR